MTSGTLGSGGPRPRPPGRLAWLRARLRSSALDRELASGVASWHSPVHAARALQLTSRRHRETYRQGLEHVLAETERPRRRSRLGAVVLPDPSAVILCAPLIWEIIGDLRAPAPVSAGGMARLRTLLCDGGGPLYRAGHQDEVCRALAQIARWLPVAS